MGLKEQQDLLARLYTDAELLSKFTVDPERIAAQFRLRRSEVRDLSALSSLEVQWYSDSLFRKRFREVKKLLPMTSNMIVEIFEPLFREFSSGYAPSSVKKHLEDALAFSNWLLNGNHLDPLPADLMRFESTRLRHYAEGRRFSFCTLSHDMRPVIALVGSSSESDIRPRKCAAVWLSLGRRTRFYFL